MPVLDKPLFGEEAFGRIRNTIVFFKRVANKNYTSTDPGERFLISSKLSYPDIFSISREAHKDLFREALRTWYFLPQVDKDFWDSQKTGLQTGFNAFLKNFLLSG